MKIDYQQFFEASYWFTANPGFLSEATAIGFFIFFTVCAGSGVVLFLHPKFRQLDKPQRLLISKARAGLITMGSIGYILLFFSYEAVPLLSMRFLFLLWGLGALLWAYLVWHFAATQLSLLIETLQKKAQLSKYSLQKRRAL